MKNLYYKTAVGRVNENDVRRPSWFPPKQLWRTFDLLVVPEPAQVGCRLAALSDTGQSDFVALHDGLRHAIDLGLLRHTWTIEEESPSWN